MKRYLMAAAPFAAMPAHARSGSADWETILTTR